MTTNPFELRSLLRFILFGIAVLLVSVYGLFQARFLLTGPVVELETETKAVYNERMIAIVGHAFNAADLTLNGRPIFTDETGHFEEFLVLENGYTIMTIRAHDRYGREKSIERSFVYRPASSI